jgi:hypothetical protein
MDELAMLRDEFGPDEVPSAGARERARTALLTRIHAGEVAMRAETHRRGRRWPIWAGMTAAAALVVVAAIVLSTAGTAVKRPVTVQGTPATHQAAAVAFLETAATVVAKKPWTTPRPDQFMYKESQVLHNNKALEDKAPNGPLVPGQSRIVVEQRWNRIDGHVSGRMSNGKLIVDPQGAFAQVPYGELVNLTTPEAVLAWEKAPPSGTGVDLDALLGQYVLPPAVQAAVFRAIARGTDVRLDKDTTNIDGRPAVGLGLTIEGYLSQELLFDKETYELIGERLVAVADHTNVGTDGTSYVHKGDVFRQAVYTASIIVDKIGDTK